MRLCWHDWKVWESSSNVSRSMTSSVICTILGFAGAMLSLSSAGTLSTAIGVPIFFTSTAAFAVGIFGVGMAAEDCALHMHQDKTCLKCGKNSFGHTKAQEKKKRVEKKAQERETLAKIVRADFKRDLGLFKRAKGYS